MTESEEDIMEDWVREAETRVVALFIHHRKILDMGFFRSNVVDLHGDGICIGLAIAYEALTGESIDAALDRLYPPTETVDEMMAGPQPDETTH